ncbi:MAG: PQQ-binding-like beta-propeller repeat protein, partial [Planctomycetota bacterium]
MNRTCLRSALTAALAAALAPASFAQSDVVSLDPLIEPGIARVRSGGVDGLPDGGAIVCYAADVDGVKLYLRRLSSAGDRVWTEVVPLPAGPLPTIEQEVAPNGDVFLSASNLAQYEKLLAFDGSTGALRWSQDLVFPTYSPNSPMIESIAATDDGDLLVASWYPTITQIQEEVRFGRFDGATGAMEWEFSAQTFFQQNTFEMRASRHGVDLVDSGLVSPPTHRALRVGVDGSVVFSSSVPSPGTGPRRLDTDDAGSLYADFGSGAYVAFDAAGASLWSRTYTAF